MRRRFGRAGPPSVQLPGCVLPGGTGCHAWARPGRGRGGVPGVTSPLPLLCAVFLCPAHPSGTGSDTARAPTLPNSNSCWRQVARLVTAPTLRDRGCSDSWHMLGSKLGRTLASAAHAKARWGEASWEMRAEWGAGWRGGPESARGDPISPAVALTDTRASFAVVGLGPLK